MVFTGLGGLGLVGLDQVDYFSLHLLSFSRSPHESIRGRVCQSHDLMLGVAS